LKRIQLSKIKKETALALEEKARRGELQIPTCKTKRSSRSEYDRGEISAELPGERGAERRRVHAAQQGRIKRAEMFRK